MEITNLYLVNFFHEKCFNRFFSQHFLTNTNNLSGATISKRYFRNSSPSAFYKKGVIKTLAMFQESTFTRFSFQSYIPLALNFIKGKTAAQVFSNWILRTSVLQDSFARMFLIFRKLEIQMLILNKIVSSINIVGTLYLRRRNVDFVSHEP